MVQLFLVSISATFDGVSDSPCSCWLLRCLWVFTVTFKDEMLFGYVGMCARRLLFASIVTGSLVSPYLLFPLGAGSIPFVKKATLFIIIKALSLFQLSHSPTVVFSSSVCLSVSLFLRYFRFLSWTVSVFCPTCYFSLASLRLCIVLYCIYTFI